MAKQVHEMIRGMGMGTRLITLLSEGVEKQGGYTEMLHALTLDRGQENLAQVCKLIVSLKWQVPVSLLMQRARERSKKDYPGEADWIDHDENFEWSADVREQGIPFVRFSGAHDTDSEGSEPLSLIADQLDGKPALPAMKVLFKGEEYIVISLNDDDNIKKGDIIDTKEFVSVYLAPAQYFLLDQ